MAPLLITFAPGMSSNKNISVKRLFLNIKNRDKFGTRGKSA